MDMSAPCETALRQCHDGSERLATEASLRASETTWRRRVRDMAANLDTAGIRQVRFVQFLHPGHEYSAARIGIRRGDDTALMGWKYGGSRHDRKFLQAAGQATDPSTRQGYSDIELQFWGEWEPPSRVTRLGRRRENWGKPEFLHHPIWPIHPPSNEPDPRDTRRQGRQNTDPFVFGDCFLYSNCQQGRKLMRTLAPGSIVVFGRGSHAREPGGLFTMDTCLVVGDFNADVSASLPESYGADLAADAVVSALVSESTPTDARSGRAPTVGSQPLGTVLYWGRTVDEAGPDGPFSFFPAARAVDAPEAGFPRLRITPTGVLKDLVNPMHQQGIRTTRVDSAAQMHQAWSEIVRQVAAAGLLLGTRADPVREDIHPERVV